MFPAGTVLTVLDTLFRSNKSGFDIPWVEKRRLIA